MIDNQIKDEKEIDYNTLRLIQKHSQLYTSSNDKKNFLKNVSAYEQKLILLQSTNPCEVLMFLAEIDTRSTKLVIEELKNEEIIDLLEKFSSEDKKNFYSKFPNLSIVNKFILKDEHSNEHVKNLSFERKTELIDTTQEETMSSATTIYQSLTTGEKQEFVSNSNLSGEMVSKISESPSGDVSSDISTESNTNNIDNKSELPSPPIIDLALNELIENSLEKTELEAQEDLKPEEESEETKEEPKPIMPEEAKEEEKLVEQNGEQLNSIESSENSELKEETQEEVKEEKDISFYEKYSIIGDGESQASIIMHSELVEKFDYESKKEEKKEIDEIKEMAAIFSDETSKTI